MRAMFAVALALSMAMAGLFMVGSGFNDVVGQEDKASTIAGELEDKANTSDTTFDSSARSEDDGSIAGFIISGTSDVVGIIWMVVAIPATLRNIGFPEWFAYPIGLGFYTLVAIGIAQFASGRLFR
jgi:hypothetical protein